MLLQAQHHNHNENNIRWDLMVRRNIESSIDVGNIEDMMMKLNWE
jgi:hypothetical protein